MSVRTRGGYGQVMRSVPADLPEGHPDRDGLAAVAGRLPGRRIVLAASVADYIADAMARRPVLVDVERQQALTEVHLIPVLPDLQALLLRLRSHLDPALRAAKPTTSSGAYPLGQCLEITLAVEARLADLTPHGLSSTDARALGGLRAFQAAGGRVRRAWGGLRGAYFQNALIAGTLYLDVANDTVVVTKPPVEIMPLAEADFSPIADYGHFARIAGRYWKRAFLPNHVFPTLAPYMPFIQVDRCGAVRVGPIDTHMLALTLDGRFAPSARVLDVSPLGAAMFHGLAQVAQDGPAPVAVTPEAGRAAALEACRSLPPEDPTALNHAILAAHDLNRRFSRLIALPQAA